MRTVDERQNRAPLVEALHEYAGQEYGRFHIPGHKGRSPSPGDECLPEALYRYDVTELPGLDDLGSAEGAILLAQQLAAELFSARDTLFLVGGASAGIVAALMSCAREGMRVCLPRNSHRSTVSALLQAGAEPVWVPTGYSEEMLPLPVALKTLRQKAKERGASVILTLSPTFEGMTADLSCDGPEIVIVDEAHGSHFSFGKGFPRPALMAPVDAVVHGAHKTFGSLTSTGFLHLTRSSRLETSRVRQALSWAHTTSPSYPLMASLDVARRQMALHGETLHAQAQVEAANARELLCRGGIATVPEAEGIDPLRLVIPSAQFGLSGHELEEAVRSAGIMLEYAGLEHVLAIFSIHDEHGTGEVFARKIVDATREYRAHPHMTDRLAAAKRVGEWLRKQPLPVAALKPRSAWLADSRARVPLHEAEGKVAAESFFPYPPGSPVLVQGEIVPEGFAEAVDLMKTAGVHFQGPSDPSLRTMQVLHDGTANLTNI